MTIVDNWYDRYGRLTIEDIPHATAMTARLCLGDWLGCAIAGSDEPVAAIARSQLGEFSDGPSRVLGHHRAVASSGAAWANAVAGHALDFDDTHAAMPGHPTAVVAPAALAVADVEDSTIGQLITAISLGNEIAVRAGAILGREHYLRGWHTTSTAGIFGAISAAAHLSSQDPEIWRLAMGLGASASAGLKCNFGTMAKPLHAGAAAAAAVRSVQLAVAGATSNPSSFEGLLHATTNSAGSEEPSGDTWMLPDISFKLHAACFGTHPAIEATKSIVNGRMQPAAVERVLVRVPSMLEDVCGIEDPRSGLEAKFSLRHVIAMVILGHDTGVPSEFSDLGATDPRLAAVRARVEIEYLDNVAAHTARVEIASADGEVLSAEFQIPGGQAGPTERLAAKFLLLSGAALGTNTASALWKTLQCGQGEAVSGALGVAFGRTSEKRRSDDQM